MILVSVNNLFLHFLWVIRKKQIYFVTVKAVFNWVSWICFGFAVLRCDWLNNSHHFLNQLQANQNKFWLACTCFPALDASYLYLLRVCLACVWQGSCVWLIVFFASVLISQDYYWFYDVQFKKPLYNQWLKLITIIQISGCQKIIIN